MRAGSTRRNSASAGSIASTATETWSTRRAGGCTLSRVPEVPEIRPDTLGTVIDDDVAAIAERAGVEDERVADPVDATALVDVSDDRDVRAARLDEGAHRGAPDRRAVHQPVEPRVEGRCMADHETPGRVG